MEAVVLEKKYKELVNEYELLHLLYHRNRNQHGSAEWWNIFNIIHRQLRHILKLLVDLQNLKTKKTVADRKQRVYLAIKYLIIKKIFTRGYYQFNGIIALGQYITLGLALVGSLGKIHELLLEFEGVKEVLRDGRQLVDNQQPVAGSLKGVVDGDDLGEVVDLQPEKRKHEHDEVQEPLYIYDTLPKTKKQKQKENPTKPKKTHSGNSSLDDALGESSKKKPKEKKSSIRDIFGDSKPKKKKKKTRKNDIDDIFG